MAERNRPQTSQRKQPKQARSTELVAAILEAAIQVLVQEGAPRFTSARVAERAGVSVGSVYQYFPNKIAILYRLQTDEWQQTTDLLCNILDDAATPPLTRLRTLVHEFIRTEFAEAAVRMALSDAAPLYRDAIDAPAGDGSWDRLLRKFMLEVLPDAAPALRARAGELIVTTLSSVAEHFSERERPQADIDAYADAMADMFCAYLEALQRPA